VKAKIFIAMALSYTGPLLLVLGPRVGVHPKDASARVTELIAGGVLAVLLTIWNYTIYRRQKREIASASNVSETKSIV
jgi:hypothetical protein